MSSYITTIPCHCYYICPFYILYFMTFFSQFFSFFLFFLFTVTLCILSCTNKDYYYYHMTQKTRLQSIKIQRQHYLFLLAGPNGRCLVGPIVRYYLPRLQLRIFSLIEFASMNLAFFTVNEFRAGSFVIRRWLMLNSQQ